MKTKSSFGILLMTVLALVFNYSYVHSNRFAAPSSTAGEPPSSSTCAQGGCHPGPAQAASTNTLLFLAGLSTPTDTLNIPGSTFKYQSNTDYNLNFRLNSTTGRYGFQIIALDAANNRAGTFAVTDANNTQLGTLGSRQYMGHKDASAFKNWTFKWTSPSTATGDITFYYAYNTANADGNDGGDVIYKGITTISPDFATSLPETSANITEVNLFPNPVSDKLNLSFMLTEGQKPLTITVYTTDGRIVKTLMSETAGTGKQNHTFEIADIPTGIYLVKIMQGNSSLVKKMIKV